MNILKTLIRLLLIMSVNARLGEVVNFTDADGEKMLIIPHTCHIEIYTEETGWVEEIATDNNHCWDENEMEIENGICCNGVCIYNFKSCLINRLSSLKKIERYEL